MTAPIDHELLAQRRARARAQRIPSRSDEECSNRLSQISRNSRDCFKGAGLDKRGLCIMGPGGVGKTTLINEQLAIHGDYQPFVDHRGQSWPSVLRVETLPNSTTKSLQWQIVDMLFPVMNRRQTEPALTKIILEQTKVQNIRFILIDELQRCVRNAPDAVKKLQDFIIGLMSSKDHPLHILLVGTDELQPALADRQIDRRVDIWRIPPLRSQNVAFTMQLIQSVVVDGCDMQVGWAGDQEKETDIARRLMHACRYCMGNIIEFLQLACFDAMELGVRTIKVQHLEERYRKQTSCMKMDNVLIATDYTNIDPAKALAHTTRKGK